MKTNLAYLYLLSPLHTGGMSQEGNLVGIAREVHTDLPYLPSSTIRGRLRAATPNEQRANLWGNTIDDVTNGNDENLTQGSLWVGDGAILWFPVPSLSHGVVWISSPFLLNRWTRLMNKNYSPQDKLDVPSVGSFSDGNQNNLYLKDAIFKADELKDWKKEQWSKFIPKGNEEAKQMITKVLVLSDRDCQILIQSSLWRQVKIKLNEEKNVDGGFRYEEAVPPETLMYFPWGTTTSANGKSPQADQSLKDILTSQEGWQIGGQESLGRGFVDLWSH